MDTAPPPPTSLVSFPDVERAEWLNKVLAQAWPFFGQYMEKLLVENIAPSIRASNTHLQTFTFTKVDMGEKPLRVLGVRAHPGAHKKQILLDLNISYVGDVQIDVEVKKFYCKAGVKGMQLHGMLRIILEPLLGDVPIVGALTMFFIRRPILDINWTGMTNLLDIPGLSSMSDTMIMDAISSYLVLPNRLLVPLVPDLHEAAQLRCPLPRGVVRVHLRGARDLRSKDRFMGGLVEGKSDPYAVLRVGTQVVTSRVIDDNLNPTWDEVYEFIVHEVPGQEMEVELFDKDPDQDDLLGRMKLDFGEVLKARVLDKWFPLQEGGQGRLHLRLEWLSLMSDASKLDQVLERNRTIVAKPDPPSAAILVVYLDRAEDLPMKKPGKEPNPMVQVSVQDVTRESKVVYNTSAPVWEDAFRFFLHDPVNQDVDIQVKDDPRQSSLGSLSLPLARLLNSPELTLDQPFQLQHSGPGSRLYMKLVLRWLPLEEVKSGRLHVRLENLAPSPSAALLEQVLHTNSLLQPARGEELSAALLSVFVDRAADLLLRKGSKPSATFASLAVRDVSVKTKTCTPSAEPVWDEGFSFLIKRPHVESLELQVKEEGGQPLGALSLPLPQLLASEGLALDGWFPLAGGGPGSQILLRAQLGPPAPGPPTRGPGSGGHCPSAAPRSHPEPAEGPLGRLQLTLWYYGEERKLVAIVHACRKLRAVSKELPDPYVSLVLLPDRSRSTKRKTSVQKKTLNPDFNERFEWDVSLEEASRRKLEANVKSTVSFMSREKEVLGKIHLDLAQVDLSEGGTHWYELRDERSSP
ncbi:PREDICTED: extended synaptotagmin-1 [Haliaeetus leucocephalus]|uniref:extended synaptotagmin-1 n=1 Tax=Haliaeetus leucocephalus TaxID=52644 RepID=UPI00053CC640|nr:PREDICTED: extended synaptotagmin-1 [Haliaeetus leucocephalus]